jgi:hypothetical protein
MSAAPMHEWLLLQAAAPPNHPCETWAMAVPGGALVLHVAHAHHFGALTRPAAPAATSSMTWIPGAIVVMCEGAGEQIDYMRFRYATLEVPT